MPSPLETILIGKVAGYLSANDEAKKNAFQRGALETNASVLIWRATKIIEAIYTKDNNHESLQVVCDYLYWLCGGYADKARRILSLAYGGIVTSPSLSSFILGTPLVYISQADYDNLSTEQKNRTDIFWGIPE